MLLIIHRNIVIVLLPLKVQLNIIYIIQVIFLFFILQIFEKKIIIDILFLESPLTNRKKDQTSLKEDGLDDCTEASCKQRQKDEGFEDGKTNGIVDINLSEQTRRRELALRQHAFFQLRLHIKRGANLVAMDRCGKFFLKIYFTE